MNSTEFKIADRQLTTLDDNVNGIMSIIKLCQPRIEQVLTQRNAQTDSDAITAIRKRTIPASFIC